LCRVALPPLSLCADSPGGAWWARLPLLCPACNSWDAASQ
jgi:hypothetical protein